MPFYPPFVIQSDTSFPIIVYLDASFDKIPEDARNTITKQAEVAIPNLVNERDMPTISRPTCAIVVPTFTQRGIHVFSAIIEGYFEPENADVYLYHVMHDRVVRELTVPLYQSHIISLLHYELQHLRESADLGAFLAQRPALPAELCFWQRQDQPIDPEFTS